MNTIIIIKKAATEVELAGNEQCQKLARLPTATKIITIVTRALFYLPYYKQNERVRGERERECRL